jgi:hypothetical protein
MVKNYMNLFLDAEITDQRDHESYSRRLDAVLAQEEITVDDIIGLGENGTGANLDLYIVHRHAITVASESGIFNKRMEVRRLCSMASIARLRGTQEGYKGREITITAHDENGAVVAKIAWGLSGPDWVEPLVTRQREHLFAVISAAMDKLADVPDRPSVSSGPSKAQALTEWAADVVRASGVEITPERVEEHANMIAAVMRRYVFMPLCRVDDLNEFYPGDEMPEGEPIATFDDLYDRVVARVGQPATVDRYIDDCLAASYNEYVRGCHEQYA